MKPWQDGINDYYKLKRDYESSIDKEVKKLDKGMSIKEKRKEFQKLKPKCIDCNRPVGTIFSNKYDKEKDGRILSAVCEDIVDPCNLNINIFTGYTETYPEIIRSLEDDIKKIKNQIIIDKNKLLFGFITTDQALEKFNDYTSLIEEKTERLTSVLELYLNEIDNSEVNQTIRTLQSEIYLTIGYIKDAITSYDRTNNTQFVQDSVNIYVNQLTPKITQIMNLKYGYKNVELENGVFRLVQKKISIEQLELTYKDSVVNNFDYKTIAYKQKPGKSKTAKSKQGLLPKNKTVKLKPGLIIEDSDTAGEEEEKEVKEYEPVEPAKFNIDANGFVTWTNPNYQKLWNNLSQQMQSVLSDNPEWMELSMDQYVQNRLSGQSAIFAEPPGLIIPPNKLSDGSFDFGNQLYNDFYNDPKNKVYQTFEPGMLRDAMNNIIAKELNFNKNVSFGTPI
jgi:hypothetical protein